MIKSNIVEKRFKKAFEDKPESECRVIRTSRKAKLMMIFMHYQPQQNSDNPGPEDEVVGIEEHGIECFPIHGEVVACVGCQRIVSNKSSPGRSSK